MHNRTACVSENLLGQTVQTGQQTLGHLELFSDYIRWQTPNWIPGTCFQDMKSCPTPAVESSKIHNGFDMAGSQFQTQWTSLSHICSIGFKSSNKLGRGRLAMFCWFFVFLDDASKVRSCNVISEHHVLAIYRVQGWPNTRFQDLVLVLLRVQSPSYHL